MLLTSRVDEKIGLVVDGGTLLYALSPDDSSIRKQFLDLALKMSVVVACRVAPKQKAEVVKLIKESGEVVTLSIGDGANDVPMILEAHCGVGLYGKEVRAAVCDFPCFADI